MREIVTVGKRPSGTCMPANETDTDSLAGTRFRELESESAAMPAQTVPQRCFAEFPPVHASQEKAGWPASSTSLSGHEGQQATVWPGFFRCRPTQMATTAMMWT